MSKTAVIGSDAATCPRERMRLLYEALTAGKRATASFMETGEALVFECAPARKGYAFSLKRAELRRSTTYCGELSLEKLEETFFDLYARFEAGPLTTRRHLRQLLVDLIMGRTSCEVDFGKAGTCRVKSFRRKLVLEVTAVNGDCLDPSSGDDWSTDALITLLDCAEKFLVQRCPPATEKTPWAIARRGLRLRNKVRLYDAGYWY